MSFLNRIKKIEKVKNKNREREIRVTHHDGDEFERLYARFQAKKKLGLISPEEVQNTIFVGASMLETDYQNMSVSQAQKILNQTKKES